MEEAFAVARENVHWPEWQLFWPLHPIAEWLGERVLSSFTRHEAPIVRVGKGLERGEACFLIQGVLSNHMSQPVIEEWFGVLFGEGTCIPLPELIKRFDLSRPLVNQRRGVDEGMLRSLLPTAVEVGREHMGEVRRARSDRLGQGLRSETRRLHAWAERAIARIEAQRECLLAQGRTLRSDEETAFKEARREVESLKHDRNEWIRRRLKTVESPHLRVVAVLVGKAET